MAGGSSRKRQTKCSNLSGDGASRTACGARRGAAYVGGGTSACSQINNDHTRRAYAPRFAAWCASKSIDELAAVQPFHIAASIKKRARRLSSLGDEEEICVR
jgi:hypothetical protein